MARKSKGPWFWEERNEWVVNVRGKRHYLGPDKNEAYDEWHRLMTEDENAPSQESVAAVLDDFLEWTQENRAERTYTRYRDFIQSFCELHGRKRVCDVNASHVTAWLAPHKTWNSTTKRNAITALQRGFNWAVKNRGLDRNPIRGMEKPEAKKRTKIVSSVDFEEFLKHARGAFRELLIVSYDSGGRPFELKMLEARHFELKKQRAVIPSEEGKGKIARAIYFPTERSMEIVTRLVQEHPTGPLFLNAKGNAWTGFAVKNAFERLEKKIGKRLNHYSLRHSFITRKLIAGVDSHVVASLSGHRDTKMIDSTYSHIAQDHEFMLKQAKRETE